jgi:quercetin dioxygenase-like cupin family protein
MYTVHKLAEMIEYQGGAVVSRVLINKPAGTVTLFAFDAGQGLSEHTAPFDVLLEVLEGGLVVLASGHEHRLTAGELIIMPANEPHELRALTRVKIILTMIRI